MTSPDPKTAPAEPRRRRRRRGFALMLSMISVAILALLVADLQETTSTGYSAAMAERDKLKAEYLARSGVNLTQMLISQEKNIRTAVSPLLKMGRGALAKLAGASAGSSRIPQIAVWRFADALLQAFADFDGSKESMGDAGYDLDLSQGLGGTGGSFSIYAAAENGKLNVNKRLLQGDEDARGEIGFNLWMQTTGGGMSPSKYDVLFNRVDEQGRMTSRQDVISNIIDWWDYDQDRHVVDVMVPDAKRFSDFVTVAGKEDNDYYRAQSPPYDIKNAPFDSLEELRLVQGVSDDFWSTFVEPSDDPRDRQITIYGGGRVNPNEAPPHVLLAKVCEAASELPLCSLPEEQTKFSFLMTRIPPGIPVFGSNTEFLQFMQGKHWLYALLQNLVPQELNLLFTPMTFSPDQLRRLKRAFLTESSMIWVESTGRAGNAKAKIKVLLNFHKKWAPPPGNPGTPPALGVFHYFRME